MVDSSTRGARGELGPTVQHAVHLHVVGVPVAAVPVVADGDVGVLLVEEGREAGSGLVDRGGGEGAVVRVLVPARHPRVGVPEPRHPVQADRGGRRLGLDAAPVDDRLVLAEVVGCLAVVAVGGEDHDHAMAVVDGASHRPRGL